MDVHTLSRLEFDKVRELAAGYACSPLGEERVRALKPSDDIDEVEARLQGTSEMPDLLRFDEPLPLGSI
ncbi:MAG TPA: DNA strand exchange inhibitor protein, partial [Candidatus Latescibacteria bacterium]|nr:DNA strand exchange inhibitor protein [Candidatus Latescibacterota bacterium]